MTGRAAIMTLRVMTKREHKVSWQLTGGGHGEPGGVWYVADHCERLDCGLTEVKGESPDKPCTCGADTLNARVEEALHTLEGIIEKFDRAADSPCVCQSQEQCMHCDLVVAAREKMNGRGYDNPDGN